MDLGLERWFEDNAILDDDRPTLKSAVFGFVSDTSESLNSSSENLQVRSVNFQEMRIYLQCPACRNSTSRLCASLSRASS